LDDNQRRYRPGGSYNDHYAHRVGRWRRWRRWWRRSHDNDRAFDSDDCASGHYDDCASDHYDYCASDHYDDHSRTFNSRRDRGTHHGWSVEKRVLGGN
jgi:hypothetical protein